MTFRFNVISFFVFILVSLDLLGSLRLVLPDWVAFWTAITALATCALGFVAWHQIQRLESQQRGWETLRICNQFDLDPTLVEFRQCLKKRWDDDRAFFSKDLKFELNTVLNYFDAIAIGISQGFYKENIVQAHLGNIMKAYRHTWLSDEVAKAVGFDDLRDGFSCFVSLVDGWRSESKSSAV